MIVPLEDLSAIRKRHQNQKIVMTSGTFDLLHVGHLNYLEKVKTYGDVLLVLLSSDDRVKARKGPLRPILPEAERGRLLDALKIVDYVFIDPATELSEEPYPVHAEILASLEPNYYVTDGADPRFITLLDKSQFVILDRLQPKPSTTDIIQRITDRYLS